jgi:hypothetical protein
MHISVTKIQPFSAALSLSLHEFWFELLIFFSCYSKKLVHILHWLYNTSKENPTTLWCVLKKTYNPRFMARALKKTHPHLNNLV